MYLNRHDIIFSSLIWITLLSVIPSLIKIIKIEKTTYLLILTYCFCFLGWESWWAIGFSEGSTNYTMRYLELQPTKIPTHPNYLHAQVQSLGDVVIIVSIFTYGFSIYPSAIHHLNYKFIYYITLIGVAQNIIFSLIPFFLPFNPNTDILSWSPIAGNVTCPIGKEICFNNQRMWAITPSIIYLCYLQF